MPSTVTGTGDDRGVISPRVVCPFTVDDPVMTQRWARLTFLHWSFEVDTVQRLLPAGLTADPWDGRAWVGLVPFFMHVGMPGGQGVPWVSNFCETNVRTYVRDRAGRTGIWFFSLDAGRLGAVAVARTAYRLPYFWSAMRVASRDDEIAYTCLAGRGRGRRRASCESGSAPRTSRPSWTTGIIS
jgi:uncharacterized protein YqjF (DUF2071 family)